MVLLGIFLIARDNNSSPYTNLCVCFYALHKKVLRISRFARFVNLIILPHSSLRTFVPRFYFPVAVLSRCVPLLFFFCALLNLFSNISESDITFLCHDYALSGIIPSTYTSVIMRTLNLIHTQHSLSTCLGYFLYAISGSFRSVHY